MENMYGIEYTKPEVILLQETGLGVPELAARTCYDSFENSENDCIKYFDSQPNTKDVNEIESSDLLYDLSHTYFHHSILEHTNLSFLIKGTSRGVLQEHARHRMQNISVRSTRYTMSGIINAFVASMYDQDRKDTFFELVQPMNMFVTCNADYNRTETDGIFDKLLYQYLILGELEFHKIAVAKSSLQYLGGQPIASALFSLLQEGKKKRNVGDAFKHIVSDNWKVDMVVTMNIRGLKNYFGLRDSGAAFFQINWLAKEMKKVTPQKYLDLIIKKPAKVVTEAEQTEKDLNELKRLTEKLGMTATVVTK